MLDKNVSELLNTQINKELYSSYLYLEFSDFYEDKGLDGFANWYYIQAQEELDHAMLMRTYLHNAGESVTLGAIDKPGYTYQTISEQLALGLQHEEYVTSLIYNIYAAAQKANDYRTMQFLDWFVKEQGEEEKNAGDLIKKYELYGSDPKGLYALNSELAGREYSEPSLTL